MTQNQFIIQPDIIKRKSQVDVLMEKVSSNEHYLQIGCEPEQVLRNVILEIAKGETWVITGKNAFALQLLLEIMANIKPYYSGRCVLAERGMMRNKRIILPHVFYIGNTSMIYNNMNVLEFLMFVSANSNFDVVTQQDRIFEQLITLKLGNISLTPISTLTDEYKAIVLLLVGLYSDSQIIILNIPSLVFKKEHIDPLKNIIKLLDNQERTLIASIINTDVIDKVFDNIAFLYDGKIIFKGKTEDLKNKYDKVIFTIEDKNVKAIKEMLFASLPQYDYKVNGSILKIINRSKDENNSKLLYERVIAAGYTPEKIKFNSKSLKNACEEIVKQYDLQK
ncbi:MAG: hypothetical protein A2Y15_06800 [Clostridiales bacterium GWF2_36_10]|nr:MAG: hypothetical protein A2Y15_06800 [Clostridiales bacterium GWF2_36_10]HAN20356.1 hypothetical protein [Clostridiales bacterium]